MAISWITRPQDPTPEQIKELTTYMDMWGRTHTNNAVLVRKTYQLQDPETKQITTHEYIDYSASKPKSDAWKAEIDRQAEAEIINNGNNNN